MKSKDNVERQQMIKAIKSGDKDFRRKLSESSGDRTLFDLMERLGTGGSRLEQPDKSAIARHSTVPLASAATPRKATLRGRVSFDSWANHPAPALRDATAGHTRRFRLAAGKVALEVVAERLQDRWEFVARVYKDEEVSSEYVLNVNKRRYLPEGQGFYHWSSQTVPKRFAIMSTDTTITFEDITW